MDTLVRSPVSDVGRLLLDQHATEQCDGTFVQRTIFHLPGLPTARRDGT
jgi:hypothetical protein